MDKKVLPISLLIPTMNRPDSLKRTLITYMESEVRPSQVIIVDQSNSEALRVQNKAILNNYNNISECVYVYQEIPSLTKARNNAFIRCKEEIVVYSDDDIDAYPCTLKNVYEIMQDAAISMIAGIDDNAKGKCSAIGYFLGTRSFRNRNIGHVTMSMLGRYPDKVDGQVMTQWAMGYFFVVRRSLMEEWNLRFDENLESYAFSEDLDFSYAYYKCSVKNNYRCILSDKVRVRHMVSTEYRIPSIKDTYMYVLNRAYLANKHGLGWRGEWAGTWCNFWRLIQRLLHKEDAKHMCEAMRYLHKYRKEVYEGHFFYGQ